MSITIIQHTAAGFVTDLGADLAVERTDGGPGFTLPRYGVWADAGRGKVEVVLATSSREEALQRLGRGNRKGNH